MPKSKRLHFKDLDGLRFFAFIPVFMFCAVYLSMTDIDGVHGQLTLLLGYIKQNSLDLFFMLSAFLLTSHGLREYKYTENFSLRNFFLRRLIRIAPLSLMGLLFAFVVHPWILRILKLNPIQIPSITEFLFWKTNYSVLTKEQIVYLGVLWTFFMFLMFYFVWGLVIKYAKNSILIVAIISIIIGIASRLTHGLTDTTFGFDLLAYGIPIGFGSILAWMVRNEHPWLDAVKQLPKKMVLPIYLTGTLLTLSAYVVLGDIISQTIIPLFTCTFFGFIIIEQTFGKNSLGKMRNNKLITHLGKISFGMVFYQSVLNVLIIIGIESMDFELDTISVKVGFAVFSFLCAWLMADLSYNFLEKPLLRFRREFKTV